MTRIGQYTPVFLPGEPPSLTEKPGKPQSTGSQRVRHTEVTLHAQTQGFLPVAALPQRELRVGAQLLGLRGPWWHQACRDTDCLRCRSPGPIRVFFRASCSWPSEGLGHSFSVAPPLQALRGLPCLRFFSVVWSIRNTEGPPGWGPTL